MYAELVGVSVDCLAPKPPAGARAGVGCARPRRYRLLSSSPRQGRSAPHQVLSAEVSGSASTAPSTELPSAVRVAAFQTVGHRFAKLAIQLEAAWLLVVLRRAILTMRSRGDSRGRRWPMYWLPNP
jgi:hypothetical protein